MKYEIPTCDLMKFNTVDVITGSGEIVPPGTDLPLDGVAEDVTTPASLASDNFSGSASN